MATTFTATVPDDHRAVKGGKREPKLSPDGNVVDDTTPASGMTLRDFYAGFALMAFGMKYADISGNNEKMVATVAYRMADCMLMVKNGQYPPPTE